MYTLCRIIVFGLNDDYLKSTVENNVGLIGKAYEEHYQTIKEVIEDGIKTGKTTDEIAKILSEKTGISKRKAEFWAQDQTSKYYGEVTKFNQTSAGFDGFIWRSVRDARVRETHREQEGKFFLWSKVTEISGMEFPGKDYRCRCFAEPEFKEDWNPSVEAHTRLKHKHKESRSLSKLGLGRRQMIPNHLGKF
ncbi:MAG: minor capsid protein [Leptospiraceae bacterium]|nr:minor capsid protein [Leptospiraceae bacterium]